MKRFFSVSFLLILLTLSGCKKTDLDPVITPQQVTGTWVAAQGGAGGFDQPGSFKNYQFTFSVEADNQPVVVTLKAAAIDVQYILFDELGQQKAASSRGRELTGEHKLNTGTYRIVVSADRRAVGDFALTMLGINGEPGRIPSEVLQSDTQNWGPLGGGDKAKTYKNHFYTFDVTEDNFSVDVEVESPDTGIAGYIYNPLGQSLVDNFFSYRYRYNVLSLKKGTYTVMVATDTRGAIGSYRLNIFGKVANLKRVESQANTVTGNWPTKASSDTYSVQLSPNNSPLDIDLTSADTPARIELQNSAGTRINYNVIPGKSRFLIEEDLPKGIYRIKVSPSPNADGGSGAYTLTVTGIFSDFKKL